MSIEPLRIHHPNAFYSKSISQSIYAHTVQYFASTSRMRGCMSPIVLHTLIQGTQIQIRVSPFHIPPTVVHYTILF